MCTQLLKETRKKIALGPSKKKMGEFIEPGTHRSINIKVFQKNKKMYFSYRIESKDFIYTFFYLLS